MFVFFFFNYFALRMGYKKVTTFNFINCKVFVAEIKVQRHQTKNYYYDSPCTYIRIWKKNCKIVKKSCFENKYRSMQFWPNR